MPAEATFSDSREGVRPLSLQVASGCRDLVFWRCSVLRLGLDSQECCVHFHLQLGQLGGSYENTMYPQKKPQNPSQTRQVLHISKFTSELTNTFDHCNDSVHPLEVGIRMPFCLLSMESPRKPCA